MSNQPRPPWFRFSNLAARAAAPPPPSAPAPPPTAPTPAPGPPLTAPRPPLLVRPSISIRPTQNPEPTPPPPPPAAAPPPPPPSPPATTPAPPPPIATPAPPPRSPIANPTPPAPSPKSPFRNPTPAPSPPKSPVVPSPPPARSPVQKSPVVPQPSPPRAPPTTAPAPRSPIPSPPPATRSPPATSPVLRSTFTNSSASPKSKAQTPSSSKPNSPKSTNPNSPPKEIKNPNSEKNHSQSPQFKALSRPPSPFTLPPAQIKSDGEVIEQKMVLETINDKPIRMNRGHNSNSATLAPSAKREPITNKATSKKHSDSEDLVMRVITVAGENRGAVMELNPNYNKKSYSLGKGTKSSDDQSQSSGEEGKSGNKNKGNAMQGPMTAYLNSNVQGLNNSIIYNSTFQHNDPGVHLSLTRKANGGRSKE